MRVKSLTFLAVVVMIALGASSSQATLVPPDVVGISTATQITEPGDHYLWFLYEIQIQWNMDTQGVGLSHLDMKLYEGCAAMDHEIEFDFPAGLSTGTDGQGNPIDDLGWTGFFERNGDPLPGPSVKFNSPHIPIDGEPGPEGSGIFWFYSNIEPEYGTYPDALVAKAGQLTIEGELQGAYPSCTVIPEPATICLFGLGGLALLRKRKR